jgi:hypothetical protein
MVVLEIAALIGAFNLIGWALGWVIALIIGAPLALMMVGGFLYAARVKRVRSG